MANKLYVNNSNGRQARASKVVFNDALGRELFAWMNGMVKDGLAETNPDSGGNQFDNLLGIGNGNHAMAIDTSASLGTITQVLATGQYPDVSLGVGPMPGPAGTGGVLVQGGALFMVNKSDPAKQAASWQFLKFLDTPESQATWAVGTGYLPIVKKAAALPTVKDFWAKNPGYEVAYDQLLKGVNTPATAGSVIGPYKDVIDVGARRREQHVPPGYEPRLGGEVGRVRLHRCDRRLQPADRRVAALLSYRALRSARTGASSRPRRSGADGRSSWPGSPSSLSSAPANRGAGRSRTAR